MKPVKRKISDKEFNNWHLYIREELNRMYLDQNPAIPRNSEQDKIEEARNQRNVVIKAKQILRNGRS